MRRVIAERRIALTTLTLFGGVLITAVPAMAKEAHNKYDKIIAKTPKKQNEGDGDWTSRTPAPQDKKIWNAPGKTRSDSKKPLETSPDSASARIGAAESPLSEKTVHNDYGKPIQNAPDKMSAEGLVSDTAFYAEKVFEEKVEHPRPERKSELQQAEGKPAEITTRPDSALVSTVPPDLSRKRSPSTTNLTDPPSSRSKSKLLISLGMILFLFIMISRTRKKTRS